MVDWLLWIFTLCNFFTQIFIVKKLMATHNVLINMGTELKHVDFNIYEISHNFLMFEQKQITLGTRGVNGIGWL